jgi:hypothetical protein
MVINGLALEAAKKFACIHAQGMKQKKQKAHQEKL